MLLLRNKIIINCDDFGLSHDSNNIMLKLLENQKISDITIMTERGFPGRERLSNYKKESFGLHLDLDQFFYFDENQHYGINENDIISSYEEIINQDMTDIKDSIKRQIEKLLSIDIKISHIDSHHSIHQFIPLIELMIPIIKEYNINKMRFNHKFYLSEKNLSIAIKIIEENNIIIPENFYDLNEIISNNISLKDISGTNQTIEVMVHPNENQYNYLNAVDFTEIRMSSFKSLNSSF